MDFDCLGTGYQLNVDNFYSSAQLFQDLLRKQTGVCSTICPHPVGFTKTTVNDFTGGSPQCSIKRIWDGSMLFVKWMDTWEVVMCSTINKAFTVDSGLRRVKEAGQWVQKDVPVPAAVKDHNQHMGGVDLSDALIGYYCILHKTKKWYKTFFFHFVDTLRQRMPTFHTSRERPPLQWRRWSSIRPSLKNLLTTDLCRHHRYSLPFAPHRQTNPTCLVVSLRGRRWRKAVQPQLGGKTADTATETLHLAAVHVMCPCARSQIENCY